MMEIALQEAEAAGVRGEVPVGAVLVHGPTATVLARAGNRVEELNDATAHAEMLVLRAAAGHVEYRLDDCDLYVTLEPCAMCAGAIIHARVARVVYGATDPRAGAGGSVFQILDSDKLNHRVQITGGVLETACTGILQDFFKKKRQLANS